MQRGGGDLDGQRAARGTTDGVEEGTRVLHHREKVRDIKGRAQGVDRVSTELTHTTKVCPHVRKECGTFLHPVIRAGKGLRQVFATRAAIVQGSSPICNAPVELARGWADGGDRARPVHAREQVGEGRLPGGGLALSDTRHLKILKGL